MRKGLRLREESHLLTSKLIKNLISRCDYLSNVVKEVLRIDPPTVSSSPYLTSEDVVICGVTIPKETVVMVEIGKYNFIHNF